MIWNFCQKAKVKGPTKHNKSQFNLRRTAISFLLIDQMLIDQMLEFSYAWEW